MAVAAAAPRGLSFLTAPRWQLRVAEEAPERMPNLPTPEIPETQVLAAAEEPEAGLLAGAGAPRARAGLPASAVDTGPITRLDTAMGMTMKASTFRLVPTGSRVEDSVVVVALR